MIKSGFRFNPWEKVEDQPLYQRVDRSVYIFVSSCLGLRELGEGRDLAKVFYAVIKVTPERDA
jgi:hypothetical protein